MNAILIIAATIAACFALREPIRKAPVAFYLLSAVIVIAFLALDPIGASRGMKMAFFWTIQKCLVPLAMFILVMYIGVFPRDSKAARWLRPIRAELSIIAWILSLGHVVAYLQSYLSPLFSGADMKSNVLLGIIVAIILFVLLIALGVTSFKFVKKRMSLKGWKGLQRFAYLFFALVYAHLLFLLMPSALGGGAAAIASVATYTLVFGVYAVARVRRAMLDRDANDGTEEEGAAA